jgi:hypothetical protein
LLEKATPVIDAAMGHIANQLNQSLKRMFRVGEDLVIISHIHEQDGSVASHVANKLLMFLTNIETETLAYRSSEHAHVGAQRMAVNSAPVYLNLLVMFAANFSAGNYPEALKFISGTIGFFQRRPVLDHHNSPGLDSRIDRLALEIQNLSTADLSNLWGILGGKYMPSVLYRVRMITFDSTQMTAQVPTILEPRADTQAWQ